MIVPYPAKPFFVPSIWVYLRFYASTMKRYGRSGFIREKEAFGFVSGIFAAKAASTGYWQGFTHDIALRVNRLTWSIHAGLSPSQKS